MKRNSLETDFLQCGIFNKVDDVRKIYQIWKNDGNMRNFVKNYGLFVCVYQLAQNCVPTEKEERKRNDEQSLIHVLVLSLYIFS